MLLAIILIIAIFSSYNKINKRKKVLFIGIDGFRRDALEDITKLDNITKYNNKYYDNTNIEIPISASSWTTIFTGLNHKETRITTNSFQGDKEILKYDIQDISRYNFQNNVTRDYKQLKKDRKNIKVIFNHLNNYKIKSYVVSAGGWDGIYKIGKWGNLPNNLNERAIVYDNDKDHPIDEFKSEIKAIDMLKYKIENNEDIQFFTLYTHNIDGNGHHYGHNPNINEYKQAVIGTSNNVLNLIDYINKRETQYQEEWLIIVTTDHGGSSRKFLKNNHPNKLNMFDNNIQNNIGIDQRKLKGIHGFRDDDFLNNSNTDTWILIIKDMIKYKNIDTTNQHITPTIIKYLIPSFNLNKLGKTHGNNLLQ